MDKDFDIGISYQNDIPREFIDRFAAETSKTGLKVESRAREIGVNAAIEWAIPTLVVTYLAKPFFDAFLKEAGKDSYVALKSGILILLEKLFGKKPEKRDKVRSLIFSLQFRDHQGRSIKCIFPEGVGHDIYEKMLDELGDLLLDDRHAQENSALNRMFTSVEGCGGSYFIEYSPDQAKWIAIDTKEEINSRRLNQR